MEFMFYEVENIKSVDDIKNFAFLSYDRKIIPVNSKYMDDIYINSNCFPKYMESLYGGGLYCVIQTPFSAESLSYMCDIYSNIETSSEKYKISNVELSLINLTFNLPDVMLFYASRKHMLPVDNVVANRRINYNLMINKFLLFRGADLTILRNSNRD